MNSPAAATADAVFQRVISSLVEAAQAVEERFAQAARAWERPDGTNSAASGDTVAHHLQLSEVGAIEWLSARGVNDADRAIAALRIASDLRRIDQLVSELLAHTLRHPLPRLPDDALEQLHHVADLTLVQLGASRDCLRTSAREQVQRVLDEETFLEDWYDVLLLDILDELTEGRAMKADLLPILTLARTLERIGDQARNITESALVISR